MKRLLTGTTIALVLAAVVHAQAAMTGTWQGESPGGSQIVLDVKATETVLTGTLTVDGQRLTIADGKVSKNMFTFTVTPTDRPEVFTGELATGELKLWMDRRGPSNAAVLKRVKS